jgi:hypothetical protein
MRFQHTHDRETVSFEERQLLLAEQFGLENQTEVHVNPVRGSVRLVRGQDVVMTARATVIGFYDMEARTWRWAWEVTGLPEALKKGLAPLRKICEARGWSGPLEDCGDPEVSELAAVAVEVLDAEGVVDNHRGGWRTVLAVFETRGGSHETVEEAVPVRVTTDPPRPGPPDCLEFSRS